MTQYLLIVQKKSSQSSAGGNDDSKDPPGNPNYGREREKKIVANKM